MRLANPSPTGGCLKDHIEFFKQKVEEMNATESDYNQKRVTIIEPIEDSNAVILKVESELELSAPGRAFTGLSRSLLNEKSVGFDSFYKENLFHGRLLSFERVYKDVKAIEDLSDTEFLIRIVILTQKPKSILTQTEKDILNQMKILASKLPNTIRLKVRSGKTTRRYSAETVKS